MNYLSVFALTSLLMFKKKSELTELNDAIAAGTASGASAAVKKAAEKAQKELDEYLEEARAADAAFKEEFPNGLRVALPISKIGSQLNDNDEIGIQFDLDDIPEDDMDTQMALGRFYLSRSGYMNYDFISFDTLCVDSGAISTNSLRNLIGRSVDNTCLCFNLYSISPDDTFWNRAAGERQNYTQFQYRKGNFSLELAPDVMEKLDKSQDVARADEAKAAAKAAAERKAELIAKRKAKRAKKAAADEATV